MSIALIAVTSNGVRLAKILSANLIDCTIFVKQGKVATDNELKEFASMKDLIADIFYKYQALIFFTSTGIAVRMVAPYLVHKAKDPAVIVIDEQGCFAISLLSGHLGGANELTLKVADILQATPVITTATDRNNLIAPDVVAKQLKLVPYPLTQIKVANSTLIEQKQLPYYIEATWSKADVYQEALAKLKLKAVKIAKHDLPKDKVAVFLSPERFICDNILVLAPRQLIIGVGCRRNVDEKLIDKAINEAKQLANCEDLVIKNLASTVVKQDEPGLLAWANHHNVKTHFWANEPMQQAIDKFKLTQSEFVKKQIGIGNVCEAAILAYNEKAKIILPKTKFEKVTVSIAWE